MQLQMTTPMDIGLERADDEIFGLGDIDGRTGRLGEGSDDEAEGDIVVEANGRSEDVDGEEEDLSDDERRVRALEDGLEDAYDRHQENLLDRDQKRKAREAARIRRHKEEGDGEWQGIEKDDGEEGEGEDEGGDSGDDIEVTRKKRHVAFADEDDGADDDSDSDGEDVTKEAERIMAARRTGPRALDPRPGVDRVVRPKETKLLTDLQPAKKAKTAAETSRAAAMWFDQPVFKGIKGMETLMAPGDEDEEQSGEEDEDAFEEEDEEMEDLPDDENDDRTADDDDAASDDSFEIVPQDKESEPEDWDEDVSDQDAKVAKEIKGASRDAANLTCCSYSDPTQTRVF